MSDATCRPGALAGHPKGLYVVSFTALWERFSFYTMRGIMTLYMTYVAFKALGEKEAGAYAVAVYGAYLGFVYATPLLGGMLADRLLGQRRAIYIGGALMALAQFLLAAHAWLVVRCEAPVESLQWLFFLGLSLLSTGNGFFKPNISTMVGALYETADTRRDTAFNLFYMGINIGALAASFSAGFAQKFGWELGFLLAGAGMIVGMIIFACGRKTIEGRGMPPDGASLLKVGRLGLPNGILLLLGIAACIPLFAYLISRPGWVQNLAVIIAGPVLLYLLWEVTRGTREEAGRMIVILVLCGFSVVFWGFYELAGSTITLFTQEVVDRNVLGMEVQAAFLANFVNPLLVIGMCIPAAAVWVWLDRRRLEPSSPLKFVLGLGFLSLGFVMLLLGAKEAQAADTGKCAMIWLILGFFFHTTGELCLSPVGLSTITKLSPARLVGLFMGVWFISSALGNVLAPWVAGSAEGRPFDFVFTRIAVITAVGAVVLLALVPLPKRMMHGVK